MSGRQRAALTACVGSSPTRTLSDGYARKRPLTYPALRALNCGTTRNSIRVAITSSTRNAPPLRSPAGKLVSASLVRAVVRESAAMTGSQALSHAFAITGKVVMPGLHPKAELLALFELLPPDATPSDVAVLASLWAHSGPTGEAFPGQKRIAREARVTDRTVRAVTKRLEKAGLFTRRVPHLATRIARKTTRYQLPLSPRPRFVRPVLVSAEAAPSVPVCPTAREPHSIPAPALAAPPEQPDQRKPVPVDQRKPVPPKSPSEIIQVQSASAPVVPQAEGLAAQWTAPTAQRPAATPSPAPTPVSPRANPKPDTAAALATLRAWIPPAKQLALPIGLTERPLESMGAASVGGEAKEGPKGQPKGS